MANTLLDLIQTYLLPQVLPVLRESLQMPALVRRDLDDAAQKKGDTIRVPLPQNMGPAQNMNTATGSTSTDLDDPYVDVRLDHWKYKQFQMDDQEMMASLSEAIIPSAVEGAIKSLANDIDLSLLSLYKNIPYFSGTAGVTPSAADSIIDVRKVLQKNLVPQDSRKLVLDAEAEANFLNIFKDVDKTGETSALREASIGRKFGFDTYSDQLVPFHTKGTAAGALQVTGAVAQGETVMNIDGAGASQTLKKGDLITIGPFQFVVTQDITANGSGVFTGMRFYPEAPIGGIADNAAITLIGSHTPNLAFHKDAFCLVIRSLKDEQSESSTIAVAKDPISNIPLRVETWRESGRATRFWRFDILYGFATLRPELAARLLG
ncbi:P22 phage major capsid protein family protein [Leptospira alexanderi]|uniref:P22 phage major capsid protein family protein n=1 Tax=Leptospira alexanderi TaxID=100053 RepID=UPI0009914CE2|nr:P22 phage major capsid protein family protein [Leptospira alexanderi]